MAKHHPGLFNFIFSFDFSVFHFFEHSVNQFPRFFCSLCVFSRTGFQIQMDSSFSAPQIWSCAGSNLESRLEGCVKSVTASVWSATPMCALPLLSAFVTSVTSAPTKCVPFLFAISFDLLSSVLCREDAWFVEARASPMPIIAKSAHSWRRIAMDVQRLSISALLVLIFSMSARRSATASPLRFSFWSSPTLFCCD